MLEKYQQENQLGMEEESVTELLLYNDNFNTFDFVIECLVDICKYSSVQAEQYAVLVHYRGKGTIKQGTFNELLPIYEALSNRNLTVELKL